jgi:hypothetical protein
MLSVCPPCAAFRFAQSQVGETSTRTYRGPKSRRQCKFFMFADCSIVLHNVDNRNDLEFMFCQASDILP